jgi:hypothetical protein
MNLPNKYVALNTVMICVDHRERAECGGRLYHQYAGEPTGFASLGELLPTLEGFYNGINRPQAASVLRSFPGIRLEPAKKEKEWSVVQNLEDTIRHRGDLATFVVRVQYRQNATWQGKVSWRERKEESSFRSALELLHLMEGAVEDAERQESEEEISGCAATETEV